MLTKQELSEPSDMFVLMFPRCVAAGLRPVVNQAQGQHFGFDRIEVSRILGPAIEEKLWSQVTHVFVCGHDTYPDDQHAEHLRIAEAGNAKLDCLCNSEVHCFYAEDVEAFLERSEQKG